MRILCFISGLINESVMDGIVRKLRLSLRPMMGKRIQSVAVLRWSSLMLWQTPKLFLEVTGVERRQLEPYLWGSSPQESILSGIPDVNGIGLRWVGYSPKTSRKALRLSQKLLKHGYPKLVLSKSVKTIKGQK